VHAHAATLGASLPVDPTKRESEATGRLRADSYRASQ
jgi:hypothetical protein